MPIRFLEELIMSCQVSRYFTSDGKNLGPPSVCMLQVPYVVE